MDEGDLMATTQQWRQGLAHCLSKIRENDADYGKRYPLVLEAIALAVRAGFPVGFRIDPAEPEWPVAFIELPTGQVSWHLPQHPTAWDGHDTEEKYRRVLEFCKSV
jgi:hypothetical protein